MQTFDRLSHMVQFGLIGWHLTRNALTLAGPQHDAQTDVYALWDADGDLYGFARNAEEAAQLIALAAV